MTKGLTMRQKICIIYYHGRGLSYAEIGKMVDASKSAVKHWVDDFNAGGDLSEKPKPGRRPTYNLSHANDARTRLIMPGFGGLAHAARALHKDHKTPTVMSKSTLHRLLQQGVKLGWKPIVPDRSRPSTALTQTQKQARLQFANDNLSRNWDNVMFTDRKRFYFRYPGCCVNTVQWRVVGTKVVARRVSRPYCANVYLGITKYGPTELVFVAGSSKRESQFFTKMGSPAKNITASEYHSVLAEHLLPQAQRLMGANGKRDWVFQQDNDPTHRAAAGVIEQYNRRHATSITLLPNWPAHSPDLSPIENGWAYLQRELDKSGCKTFDAWLARLQQLVSSVPKAWLANAFQGMTARLQDTIGRGGDKTRH